MEFKTIDQPDLSANRVAEPNVERTRKCTAPRRKSRSLRIEAVSGQVLRAASHDQVSREVNSHQQISSTFADAQLSFRFRYVLPAVLSSWDASKQP